MKRAASVKVTAGDRRDVVLNSLAMSSEDEDHQEEIEGIEAPIRNAAMTTLT
jgi:hypothetical protein